MIIRIFNGCEVQIKNSVMSDGIFNSHRTTIIDSFSCILFLYFKLGYALFYQFYAEISTFSIKKCLVQLRHGVSTEDQYSSKY